MKLNYYVSSEEINKAVVLRYYEKEYETGKTKEERYKYCVDGKIAPITRIGGYSEATFEVSDHEVAEKIAKYGCSLSENSNYNEYIYVDWAAYDSFKMEVYMYGETDAPDIYAVTESDNESGWPMPEFNVDTTGNVLWYQRIDRDLRIKWDFMQPFTTQAKYEIGVGNVADSTDTSKIKIIQTGTTENNLTINRKLWQDMVKTDAAGNIKFLLWIRVTGANGAASEWKYIQICFVLHKLELESPEDGTTWRGEDSNTISWKISADSSFVDDIPDIIPDITGFSIYISSDGGATFAEFANLIGESTSYVFPENTLPVGKVIWKAVPLYDNNTVDSIFYAGGGVLVRVSAETSTVSCDGKPLPTVYWESVAQASYQVKFGDYNSGAVYSSQKYHKIPYFFSDGVYEVTVRTQIPTGEWSEWSEPVYVQITNVPPALGITATAEPEGYRVKVVWTKNSGYVDYIVYRNGVPIHVTDGGISTDGGYMDSMANGVAVYMVRGITADGYYDQSAEITVNADVQTDILFALGSDEILPLKYTPVFPRTYNYASEMAVTYRYFAGRSKPVAITSGLISRTLPLSYIDKGRTLARKLLSYVGKTVVFKDSGGDMIVGVLNMANAGMGHVSTTSFQITEVDYNERVAYLPGE